LNERLQRLVNYTRQREEIKTTESHSTGLEKASVLKKPKKEGEGGKKERCTIKVETGVGGEGVNMVEFKVVKSRALLSETNGT